MIAKSRHMAAHDFLLVSLSAAVLALLLWPPGPAVREVEVRRHDGSLQTYQLTADDPKLANLTQKLQRWSNPKHNSRTAINKWNVELGSLYAERTMPEVTEEVKRILPVSYYPDHAKKREAANQQAAQLKQQQAFWLAFKRQAEQALQTEQKRHEDLLALHANPPISISVPQPGPHSPIAILSASLIGLCVAMVFSVWNFFAPSLQLAKQASVSSDPCQSSEHAKCSKHSGDLPPSTVTNSLQFKVTLPARWLKVHQPTSVWIRQTAYFLLIASVVLVSSTSVFNPRSDWRGLPARMLWGEYGSGSASPLHTQSNNSMLRMQKSNFSPKTS